MVLGIEPRVMHIIGKYHSTELHPLPTLVDFLGTMVWTFLKKEFVLCDLPKEFTTGFFMCAYVGDGWVYVWF